MGGDLPRSNCPWGRPVFLQAPGMQLKCGSGLSRGARAMALPQGVAVGGTVSWPGTGGLPGGGGGSTQEAKDETCKSCGGLDPRLGSHSSQQGGSKQGMNKEPAPQVPSPYSCSILPFA